MKVWSDYDLLMSICIIAFVTVLHMNSSRCLWQSAKRTADFKRRKNSCSYQVTEMLDALNTFSVIKIQFPKRFSFL